MFGSLAAMDRPHIPAWKRLGLKLKNAADESQSSPTTPIGIKHTTNSVVNEDGQPRKKMRFTDSDDEDMSSKGPESKSSKNTEKPKKLKKQVSFTTDTKRTDGDSARAAIPSPLPARINETTTRQSELVPSNQKAESSPTKKAKVKSKRKQKGGGSPKKPSAALEYLSQFYADHTNWKFNKNHEVWILKHAFSETDIPTFQNFALACYLHGLKSASARQRLLADCETKDSTPDTDEKADLHDDDSLNAAEFVSAIKSFVASPKAFVGEKEGQIESLAGKQRRTNVIVWALNEGHNVPSSDETKVIGGQPAIIKGSKSTVDAVKEPVSPPPSYTSSPSATRDQGKSEGRRDRRSKKRIASIDYSSSSSSSESDDSSSSRSSGSSGSEGSNGSGGSSGSAGSSSDASSDSD